MLVVDSGERIVEEASGGERRSVLSLVCQTMARLCSADLQLKLDTLEEERRLSQANHVSYF